MLLVLEFVKLQLIYYFIDDINHTFKITLLYASSIHVNKSDLIFIINYTVNVI
jgi:hypothetical protein